ncbi:hypothetical protein RJT34_09819 [Clitoria ternatea]|uniref:Uncharacterized protein n=1 Tax=Clitoria ternatea TaxID=43366 RepID=A0AAN9K7Q7_CLITE
MEEEGTPTGDKTGPVTPTGDRTKPSIQADHDPLPRARRRRRQDPELRRIPTATESGSLTHRAPLVPTPTDRLIPVRSRLAVAPSVVAAADPLGPFPIFSLSFLIFHFEI